MPLPSLYEPLNEYKPFAPHVGIVDGTFEYLKMSGVTLPLPFTTRMTVVQLKNGDLFLHSPIAFDAKLAGHLQSMGTIRHLISPNQFHYAHIGEWARAFPDAVTWASAGAHARGVSTWSSKWTLARMHHSNGATKSINLPCPVAFSENSSFSTKHRRH
jgi:Domain of unknown function (DUF4336)